MSKTFVINGVPYQYPVAGENPGWGGDATAWAEAVTNLLTNLFGPNDIPITSYTIANNQSTFADIVGLVFDGGSVRKSTVNFSVYRRSDSNTYGHTEGGTLTVTYDNNAPDPWSWTVDSDNDSGINFNITSLGQVQYKSTDIGSANYVGLITFTSKALGQ